MKKLLLALFCLLIAPLSVAYVPEDYAVFVVRGLNSNEAFPPIVQAFHAEFPTIPLVMGRIGDGSAATTNRGMYHLLDDLYADASTNAALAGKRVIVIGFSQGGLLARAFIEKYSHLLPFTIDSLISCASPQGGEFGLPDSWAEWVDLVVWHADDLILQGITNLLGIKAATIDVAGLGAMTVEEAVKTIGQTAKTRGDILDPLRQSIADLIKSLVAQDWPLVRIVFYNAIGQDLISVANYWKDPEHQADYLALNSFLPYFNNDKDHANAALYKTNIQKLNYILMLWANTDFVIKPDCSGAMRFFKWGSKTALEKTFTETSQYTSNLLGLRDMYDNGRLFFECPYGMGHGCEGPGITIAMNYLRAIVTQRPPNEIFDAVKNNDLAYVQLLLSEDNTRAVKRNGFGQLPIYYAGNKPEIAQLLFNQALLLNQPLSIAEQSELLINAFGSGSLAIAQWLIETLHFNPADIKPTLISVADENHQTTMISYINSVVPQTLHGAVAQNNLALATQMVTANPALINQLEASMLPIYFAGNKLEIAQYLFAQHRAYGLLTLQQVYQLLYFACGAGSLPVVQWIIEGLYFDITGCKDNLTAIAQNNYQYHIVSYLNTFINQGRASLETAVCYNNLALVTQIVNCNPVNIEHIDSVGMLPILYAGNKVEMAQYLYNQHNVIGRPLTPATLNTLLYYAFGSGSLPVAQWLIEGIHLEISSLQSLVSIAQANGQAQMIDYLRSLGLIS
ncbi:TPA: hypothetical protein DDZ86_05075 [Candidatus Dependentiae bacterium]|nr:MAG: hypothetical protein A2Y17_09880 [Clostridiales bacterium GWF2_38_85]HBL98984.1 hypothetical protein [Candidatus Dependentiae bacterium]